MLGCFLNDSEYRSHSFQLGSYGFFRIIDSRLLKDLKKNKTKPRGKKHENEPLLSRMDVGVGPFTL